MKKKFHLNLHIVLLSAIVIIIIICAYRLYKWDQGTESTYDPNFQTTEFDVEALDSIIPLAPDKLEGMKTTASPQFSALETILFP